MGIRGDLAPRLDLAGLLIPATDQNREVCREQCQIFGRHGIARIRSAADRAKAALDTREPGALGWMLSFNGNPAPLRLLTVAMVHESHHHLRDVSELAGA